MQIKHEFKKTTQRRNRIIENSEFANENKQKFLLTSRHVGLLQDIRTLSFSNSYVSTKSPKFEGSFSSSDRSYDPKMAFSINS